MDQAVLFFCFLELEQSWRDLGCGVFLILADGKFRTTVGRTLENPCPESSWWPSEMLESILHIARSLHICN